jgi:hypothetical protein
MPLSLLKQPKPFSGIFAVAQLEISLSGTAHSPRGRA